jgi:uncharacterized phage-associated protein
MTKLNNQTDPSASLNIDKIGNLLIYIVDKIEERYHQKAFLTKLLRLLYIIDETAVKETGAPVTGLDYRVWKMGPVAFEVYKDLMHEQSETFRFFVEGKKRKSEKYDSDYVIVESVNKFRDDEFSEYELETIDRVIDEFGYLNGPALIELLHEDNSLWAKVVQEKNLEKVFERTPTTNHKIDLVEIIDDDFKKELYKTSQQSLQL